MAKIYHNPRCTKSRETLSLLKEHNKEVEIIEYLKEPPSRQELEELIDLLGLKPLELIRKNEVEFKENFKGKDLSDEEWVDAMLAFPKLIERPIVINEGQARIGRPPSQIIEIL